MKPITFGIKTAPQHTTYEAILKVWKQADENPAFDHAWLFDHYAPIFSDINGPCLEGWTTLAALAAETSRIRLGLMVTGNTYRHPAILASIAATVDIISNGRVSIQPGKWLKRLGEKANRKVPGQAHPVPVARFFER
jgi:alkanesulfonate monooxygenase SsuD/methylene tetrahydromethanopterin reductase-like flavin-dependent oxidoreductase (luciferase family)